MGDPKFSRKKYDTPSHPWEGERITNENELLKKYGLKNKKELWRTETQLRVFRQRARKLQAKVRYGDLQAEKERDELMKRLDNLGLINEEASLDDILTLNVESLLGRRLQTIAYMKGLSNSPKQARQFIVHGHVSVDGRKITIPGYFVKRTEEEGIDYLGYSPLADDMHPARPRDELATDMQQAPRADEPPAGDATAEKPVDAPADTPPAGKPEAKPIEKTAEEPAPVDAPADTPPAGKPEVKPIEKTAKEPAPAQVKAPPAEKPAGKPAAPPAAPVPKEKKPETKEGEA